MELSSYHLGKGLGVSRADKRLLDLDRWLGWPVLAIASLIFTSEAMVERWEMGDFGF